MEAVSGCTNLRMINDFPWSKTVLFPNVKELRLEGSGLQQDSAMTVFVWLLPRAALTVTLLNIRCGMGSKIDHRD